MGVGEIGAWVGGLFGLLLHLAVVGGLFFWAGRVARRRGGLYRTLRWLPLVGLLLSIAGCGGTVVGLVQAFGAVAHAAPEQRALRLSEGIDVAMWFTAGGLIASGVCYVASAITSAVGTWSKPARQRAAT